jgi:dihydroneopterin aldolase
VIREHDVKDTDTIFISALALHAYHGVMPHEGKVGQSFKLDITLDIDLDEAARSDRLRHTVSYDQVAAVATEAFCKKPYKLIEAAAGAVIDALLHKFPRVTRVRITVHKPHAPIAATFDDVGVIITRGRGK